MRVYFKVTEDTASPAISGLSEMLSRRQANKAMAESVAVLVQEHLRIKNAEPNKLGGAKTQFYSQARDATFSEATMTEASVYIAKDGMRQRFHGGLISPVKAKALTIPVHPMAHGRVASEFGEELRFVPIQNKVNIVGLLRLGTDSAAPVLYILVKRVDQLPDPSVLPSEQDMRAAAIEGLAELPI